MDFYARDNKVECVVTKKCARNPLIRSFKNNKDVPGHEERLLMAWDEGRCGKICAEASQMSTS